MDTNSYLSKLLIERDQLERYMSIIHSARTKQNVIIQDELDYELNKVLKPEIIIWG